MKRIVIITCLCYIISSFAEVGEETHILEKQKNDVQKLTQEIMKIEQLCNMKKNSIIQSLMNSLKKGSPTIKRIAARKLGKSGIIQAIPLLKEVCKGNDEVLRGIATVSIHRIELRKRSIKDKMLTFKVLLDSEDYYIRQEAAWVLGDMGEPAAEIILQEKMLTEGAAVRAYYKIKLKQNDDNQDKRVQKLFQVLIEEADFPLKCEVAVEELIEIGTPVIPTLIKMLQDKRNIPKDAPPPFTIKHTFFSHLIDLCIGICNEETIPILMIIKENPNSFVRSRAEFALEWIGSGVPYPYKYQRIIAPCY